MASISEKDLLAKVPTQLYINGTWVDAEGGKTLDVFDPATGELLAKVADASPADGMRALDAKERIEELRYIVADAGITSMHDQPLTVSIGCASYPKDGSDAESLLAEADRRMYQEKQDRKAGILPASPARPAQDRKESYRSPYVNKSVDIFASSSL